MATGSLPFKDELIHLDRSTLEAWATCPAMARLQETAIKSVGGIAVSGNESHEAIGLAIQAYVDSNGNLTAGDIAHEIMVNAASARPDHQVDVIESLRRSAGLLGKIIVEIHADNIMHFDGGQGMRSGQLSWEIAPGIVVTSEVDFLASTRDKTLLEELDWKTGHKRWTDQDILDSFQFQLHWSVIAHNYPDVECLRVRVVNTRLGNRTWAAEFDKRKLEQCRARVNSAVGVWLQQRHKEQPDAWPDRDKCEICDCAAMCPGVDKDIRDVANNPGRAVDHLVSLEAQVAALKKLLKPIVTKQGDITSALGNSYGSGRPKASRAPTLSTYKAKPDDVPSDDDGGPTPEDMGDRR